MATPKLRFKEFDGDWFQSKIGEIFQVTSGSTPLRSDNRFFENADIAWVKTTDLNNGLIEKTEEKISQIALKETSVKILPKGTVFVAMYGGFNQIGRTGLLVHEAACNQALSAIYPNEKIDSYFLLTFLNHKVDDWKNFAASSRKDPNITKSDVLAFPLKYPVKEEQTKIASFLCAVDEKISQLNQKHQLLSQYKQGMMQKLFSQQIRFKADDGSEFGEWKFIKLNQLGKSYNGLTGKTKDDFGNGDAYVTYKQIFDNRKINLQKIDKVNIQPHETQNRVIKGDLFFTTSSEIPEEVAYCSAILDDFDYPLYLNSFCFGFRPNNQNQLNSNYASFFFRSNQFRNTILHLAQGSTRFNISKTAFMDMKIALPRVEEQTKIANFLSAIDQKIEVVAQQIEQAKQWKKGLLQQMFV